MPADSGSAAVYQSATLSGADYSGLGIPFTTEELQSLVAPVALYQDPLLAQVLIAATFPDQVMAANLWLQQNQNLPASVLMPAVNAEPWDPSVKGLTQFPSVVNNLAQNLTWTSQLGEAYHNQPSAVMAAVQSLRAKARTSGNLSFTVQLRMAQPSGDITTLEPGNPLVVYVPQYNPAFVYGKAMQTPAYRVENVPANGSISYSSGTAIAAMASSDFGWSNWSCNWYQGAADYKGYPYYGNHAWRGGYYGGYVYYGNHPYHNDANRPFASRPGAQANPAASQSATGKHAFTINSAPAPTPTFNAWAREAGGWTTWDELRGWEQSDPQQTLTAFSSWSNQAGFGTGGWGDRSVSYRGWLTRGGNSGWGIGGRATGMHW